MSTRITRRRLISMGAQAAMAVGAAKVLDLPAFASAQSTLAAEKYSSAFQLLDRFIAQHMKEFFIPGMTLGIANKDGVLRTAGFGCSDVKLKLPVNTDQLFEIGSITKSFVGIALLALRDEGKLDLHKPVVEYLPWLKIKSNYRPITTHDLLTHSSGLPSIGPVFATDPNMELWTGFAPGEHFSYCNLGYSILGLLLEKLDGRTFSESLQARIFGPLGMTSSAPIINSDIREHMPVSYVPLHDDRPLPRGGKLMEAPVITVDTAAGCIASTPHDMALYVQMLLNQGKGPKGRIISEEAFKLFSTPHIKADEFGPNASYGYGLAIDAVDGHKILRHTGGMVSFASAMWVDLDEGVGAFASTNQMQQPYRPNSVTAFALKSIRAVNEGKPLPPIPAPVDPMHVANAKDYVGSFAAADGRKLEVVTDSEKLFLKYKGQQVPLESKGGDLFLALHPDFEMFVLAFGREKGEKSPIVEVAYGPDWYTNEKYSGPREFTYPKEWDSYVGHYRSDDPWTGDTVVVLRKGKLWSDGVSALIDVGGNVFRAGDDDFSPERVKFLGLADGKAWHLKLSGADMWRVRAR